MSQEVNEAPIINIGPREVLKRRLLGFTALVLGVGMAFLAVVFNAPRWSRLAIFFPIWIAGLGLFQAREKVCIALASKGTCNMDSGEGKVASERLAEELRKKARQINRRAIVVAAVVTMVVLAFPA